VKQDDIRVQALSSIMANDAVTTTSSSPNTQQQELDTLDRDTRRIQQELNTILSDTVRLDKEYEMTTTMLRNAKAKQREDEEFEAPKREQLDVQRKFLQAKTTMLATLAGFSIERVEPSGLVVVNIGHDHHGSSTSLGNVELVFNMTTSPVMLEKCSSSTLGLASSSSSWERALAKKAIATQHPAMYVEGISRALRSEAAVLDDIRSLATDGTSSTLPKREQFLVTYDATKRVVTALFLMGSVSAKLRIPISYGMLPIELVSIEDTCGTKSYTAMATRVVDKLQTSNSISEWIWVLHREIGRLSIVIQRGDIR
jgi:hypothetical protein